MLKVYKYYTMNTYYILNFNEVIDSSIYKE